MPIQAPQWTDYLNCPACCREFGPMRSPVSLGCGHTLCRVCLKNIHRKQCPFDQTVISVELEELVVNTALLQLAGYSPPAQPIHPPCVKVLSEQDRNAYDAIVKCQEQLAVFLKSCGNANVNMIGSRLSRPMQRKLVTLLQCAMTDEEGRGKAARAVRSLGERSVTELILQHQNPQQLSANLWAAVRARGCQFLGPAMQEEVLKLVLLALEDGSALSRKVLVMFVVQRLEPDFPQASKTSIGHVVQLLYRASCFKVSKRESDSSLMQLKEEFRTYECLRREHDAQIVQIATEAGLRLAPDQWSALLYGDTHHKSHMQSIIDKLQTPQSFAQSVQELFIALQRTGDPAQLIALRNPLDRLANIDSSLDAKNPTWQQLSEIMQSLKEVVSGLVQYIQHQSASRDANVNAKSPDRPPEPPIQQPPMQGMAPGRYKVAMCRDAQTRTFCPRGNNCTYAHSEEELERYRRMNAANNGNYQYLMPVLQPIAVARPIYFSVPPPPIPIMEGAYNVPPPPIQQQISPSQRRPMIGADVSEHDQVREPLYEQPREPLYEQPRELSYEQPRELSYEQPREPLYEQPRELSYEQPRELSYEQPRELSYEQPRELSYEPTHARRSPYDTREFDRPYEQREQPFERGEHLYEHREPPYDDCEQILETLRDPNAATDNYVTSYVAPPMHGGGSEAVVGPIGSASNIQNGNLGHMLPPSRVYYPRFSEHATYPYNGRMHNEELVQYPNVAGISGSMGQVESREYPAEYLQPCYDENGREMHYNGNPYGLGVSRPLAQPQEHAWPAPNTVKRPPMFKFNKTAKNVPLGMEIGQTISMALDITKNNVVGSSQINGYVKHPGMEAMRIKPKGDKRDDQEILEKELQALERRISTEFCKSSDRADSGSEDN